MVRCKPRRACTNVAIAGSIWWPSRYTTVCSRRSTSWRAYGDDAKQPSAARTARSIELSRRNMRSGLATWRARMRLRMLRRRRPIALRQIVEHVARAARDDARTRHREHEALPVLDVARAHVLVERERVA